jgi:NAD-dependent dihydropyrimidine dehydrogenase PreA subunit
VAAFLESGFFQLYESKVERSSSVRIIGTCQHDPQTLIKLGALEERLVSFFAPRPLRIPPLRKRKKDLKQIVDHLIRVGNRRSGKTIQGIDQAAYQRLMAHDWPGNFEELETTIVRAVSLASGDHLTSEDIFFGLKPVQGKWSLNLLQFGPLKQCLQSRLYPGLFQGVTALLFLTILFLAFWGPESGQKLVLDLTWGVWEPMAVLAALLLGRFWCAICPLRGLVLSVSRRFSLKLEPQPFIRGSGPFLSTAGIALIIWAEITWDLFSSAGGTAVLLLVLTGLGIMSGLVFRKLVWCRHLCPLGALLGLMARCSFTEMRSHHSVCNNDCQDHPCVGRHGDSGCPMLEAPFTLHSNQDCVLCGECVKLCPENSPEFNLRIPGYELGNVRFPTALMNILVPVLLGTQLFRGLVSLKSLDWIESFPGAWAVYLTGLGLCSLLAVGMISLAGSQMFGPLIKSDLKKGWLLNYALVPMLFAYELGYHLKALLIEAGWILPELGTLLDVNWDNPAFFFSRGMVDVIQTLLMVIGFAWAALLINQIARHHHASGKGLSKRGLWPMAVFCLVLLAMLIIQ